MRAEGALLSPMKSLTGADIVRHRACFDEYNPSPVTHGTLRNPRNRTPSRRAPARHSARNPEKRFRNRAIATAPSRRATRHAGALMSAGRKGQVAVRRAGDVETFGIFELRGVAVGGADATASRACRGRARCRRARSVRWSCGCRAWFRAPRSAEDFLDPRGLDQLGMLDQPAASRRDAGRAPPARC